MLSVVLYGRNDNHGYNYHKRLAISLNCLAELLTDASDEIIFVDYNSPDDLPTIVEAIQDTLTEKAKQRIKILRVREDQHARFHTSLPLLEPVARNVGVRRSHPLNPWILSTNVDMVFVPQGFTSLTDIVASLQEGYYSLPRFELPENLWEINFRRLDPVWNLNFLQQKSALLHLDTVIRKQGFIQYDNPGDFQLVLRKDLFNIRGFDETMLKGWHVDSNLAKRLHLINRESHSLEKVLKGYHCNHTHQESVHHRFIRTENNWSHFVDNNNMTSLANGEKWGLADEEVEEIFLDSGRPVQVVSEMLSRFPSKNYDIMYDARLYNHHAYSTPRIFTYLVDHLYNISKSKNIVYFGNNVELSGMLQHYLEKNNFKGKLLHSYHPNASMFIFDFGWDEQSLWTVNMEASKKGRMLACKELSKIKDRFFEVLRQDIQGRPKFIGINVNYTDFNLIFLKHLSMRLSSYITGNCYGYLPPKKKIKFIPFPYQLKKKIVFNLRYYVSRYFPRLSDRLHRMKAL